MSQIASIIGVAGKLIRKKYLDLTPSFVTPSFAGHTLRRQLFLFENNLFSGGASPRNHSQEIDTTIPVPA